MEQWLFTVTPQGHYNILNAFKNHQRKKSLNLELQLHCKHYWFVLNSMEIDYPTFGVHGWLVCQFKLSTRMTYLQRFRVNQGVLFSHLNVSSEWNAPIPPGFILPAYPKGSGSGSHRNRMFSMDLLKRER